MNVNEISKLIELNAFKNVDSQDSDTSTLFELLLQSLMENPDLQNNVKSSSGIIQANPIDSLDSIKDSSDGSIPQGIMNAIDGASEKYGIDSSLIKSVIKQESDFNPNAISSAGAQGLMQLMPGTADSLGVNNPLDVLENINGGTKYLRELIDKFKGNQKLALTAYNGGMGRMERLGVTADNQINKMPSETRNYVAKVIQNYEDYKKDV
jgi:soluble lytic murein transglycosylase-like protein